MSFYSTHTHHTHSYGDGFATAEEHAARLVELGISGAALTDHGNVSGHAQWEKAFLKAGLHPAFGCELYTSPPYEKRKWHQTVVAENLDGYHNLCKLVTASWTTLGPGNTSASRWPTCHSDMLAEYSPGIISTSGCADSLLACTLLGGKSLGEPRLIASELDIKRAGNVIEWFKEIYGDGYYLEVQRFPELERTRVLNPLLAALSTRHDVPLVATADVHYPYPHQNEMQKVLHAAMRGGTVESVEAEWEYSVIGSYPLSDRQVRDQLIATGLSPRMAEGAIAASAEIGQRCQVTLPKSEPIRYPGTVRELSWT